MTPATLNRRIDDLEEYFGAAGGDRCRCGLVLVSVEGYDSEPPSDVCPCCSGSAPTVLSIAEEVVTAGD